MQHMKAFMAKIFFLPKKKKKAQNAQYFDQETLHAMQSSPFEWKDKSKSSREVGIGSISLSGIGRKEKKKKRKIT